MAFFRQCVFRDRARGRDFADLVHGVVGEPDVPIGSFGEVPRRAFGGQGIFGDRTRWGDLADRAGIEVGEPEVGVRAQRDASRIISFNRVFGDRAGWRDLADFVFVGSGKPEVAFGYRASGDPVRFAGRGQGIFADRPEGL